MKKTLIVSALLVGSLSAYSQGTVTYADRISDITIHIYAPNPANPSVEQTGDAAAAVGVSADNYAYNGVDANVYNAGGSPSFTSPAITTGGGASPVTYGGGVIGNTSAGNPTAAGAFNYNNGSDFTAMLYAAPGLNAAASALVPVTQYTSVLQTSSSIGGVFKNFSPAGDVGMPFSGANATLALVVWWNNGGTLTAANAKAAGDPWGESPLFNMNNLYLGGAGTPPDLQGLQSFSLAVVPEPSTIALGVIGASSLLFRRRK